MSALREIDGPRQRAVVLAVQLPGVTDDAFASSLTELERLAETLGMTVIGRVTQKRDGISAKAVVGDGKLNELKALTGAEREDGTEDETKASVVLVDHDLSPSQTRTLSNDTKSEVLDRSMLILSIFQRHARTREARTQVEIARLTYMTPRVRASNAGHDRQRGGIGGKGAGETAHELDRRRIRDRISELKREIETVTREAETQRSRRVGQETSSVALVGYTNAGKSSLMRALTGDEVYVADQLFATLDTTVRVLKPETKPRILVSDTVGFIKHLPHDLVASFRSTLQEAKDAGLLLHLIDASDPAFRDQLLVTREVLAEIHASENPTLLVLNKADRLSGEQSTALAQEFPDAVIMSTRSPDDVQRLHQRIVSFFDGALQEASFVVPYTQQRKVALMHERGKVLDERYEEDGTHIRLRAPASVIASLHADLDQA